ncbi:MAG: hypothetical protein QM676_07675 [Novosphingobium sp.]
MKLVTRLYGALKLALLTALAAAPVLAQDAAEAPLAVGNGRVISNVATIEWDQGTQRLSQASNQVDVTVTDLPVPLTLSAYRFADNSASVQFPVSAPLCGGGPAALAPAWSRQSLSPASVIGVTEIRPGEPFLFKIESPAHNLSAAAIDTIEVEILAASGDSETLTAYETGANTGVFTGFVQTWRSPPPGTAHDCGLAVEAGDAVEIVTLAPDHRTRTLRTELRILADPLGYVFDSATGEVISGVAVTLVDAATGQPAAVFGDDGVSAYPATVVTGSTLQDGGGTTYRLDPGLYRFPLVMAGTYRLRFDAPAGYTAPSQRTPAQIAPLRQPDGRPFTIDAAASYGGAFTLSNPEPVEISLPVDKPGEPLVLTKQASSAVAQPGDALRYKIEVRNPDPARPSGTVTVTDSLPASLRLRPGSLRLNGQPAAPRIAPDGHSFTLALPPLAPEAGAVLTYAVDVRPDAAPGNAVNRAVADDSLGTRSNVADAPVRIVRDELAARLTIIGRITDGGCAADPKTAPGVPNVRVMLEDGSYAVTDRDGRYHFEGVVPGTHVVQLDDMTLPAGRQAIDCARSTRSAGRAFSRFVAGRGGDLKRVDFAVAPGTNMPTPLSLSLSKHVLSSAEGARPAVPTDAQAAGAERDWLAGQAPGVAWLFPEAEHNPRAPLVRVAIKHAPGQSVKLFADGRPVDPIAFEGTRKNAGDSVAVSLWRGIPLEDGTTRLTAEVRGADGALAETLQRTVRYGGSPIRAELVRDHSVLVADGVTRPVLAVRLTDREGRPIRHGTTGDFELPAPYYPAVEADAQQARQLAGLERARPFWRVQGDEGVAYIELEPTTASGTVSLRFNFRDGKATREQRLETWLEPGQRAWTIVGLAEGTLGFNHLLSKVEPLGPDSDKLLKEGRVALYAKGRVQGKWLMTLAYDSDKQAAETRFGGTIDPATYYTVYADRSERRHDAASLRKLYLKLERPRFYALFGDYETGIDEPELTRYVRALTGVKAEYRSPRLSATTFAAETENRHGHDEIQGNGLSGPYVLSARGLLANSEKISIQVRDRLRSEQVVETRLLTRYADYEIDYAAGTLRFREPILSRDSSLNPQFILVDYEVDGAASTSLNAGARIAWRSRDEKLQIAATAIRDASDAGRTTLVGTDLRYRPSAATEIRAEAAASNGIAAWQVEAEHHGKRLDALGYVRQRESGFGVGQSSGAEDGTRKVGADIAARFGEALTLTASAWHDEYLDSDARRIAARALAEYRRRSFSARAGITLADDQLADGRTASSTILQLGATKRLIGNKLELDAQTELPLGKTDSIDFPARHRLAARYALSKAVALTASYEIAVGDSVDARTARLGFDLTPWAGARITASGNMQDITEYGPRTFAAFGLSQSVMLNERWSLDATLDSSRTLGGIDPSRVLDAAQPVASGGFVGANSLTEDFTAATFGATYRAGDWSMTGRAEYRAGEHEDRYGLTAAALRQIGDGSAVGGAFSWFIARSADGTTTATLSLQVSWAHRPAGSAWSWLDKFELRRDSVTGDASSTRAINSLSLNYTRPRKNSGIGLEASLFWGARYSWDKLDQDDIESLSNMIGADVRLDLADTIDLGAAGTVRHSLGARAISFSAGPSLGYTPAENAWLSVGYNLAGFADRDFEQARYTRSGPYVTLRFKFDQLTLRELGLKRR